MKKVLFVLCFFLVSCAMLEPLPASSGTIYPTSTNYPTVTATLTLTPDYQATNEKATITTESITQEYSNSLVTQDVATIQANLRSIAFSSTSTAIYQRIEDEALKSRFRPYFSAVWLAGLFLIVLGILIWLLVQSIVLYNRNQPIVFEDNSGGKLVIPSDKFDKLPASFMREMAKQVKESKEVEEIEISSEIKPIALPAIAKGHVLIVGPTGAGKTTAMRAIIRHRENVVVIDPHNDGGATWGNLRVIGGGLNFESIQDYIQTMDREIVKRFEQRLKGKKDFIPLTVVVDELPAIIMEIGKEFGAIWAKWIMQGRKVGLFVMMGSQSSRVAVLGIEGKGDILENFNYVITLDKKAQAQYKDLVKDMERPAVIHSVNGIFPVIIPNVQASEVITNHINIDNITPSDEQRIINMYLEQGNTKNLAEIQKNLFGYSGGGAYYTIKNILSKHNVLIDNN